MVPHFAGDQELNPDDGASGSIKRRPPRIQVAFPGMSAYAMRTMTVRDA